MKTSRRRFVAGLSGAGAMLPLSGCERIWSRTSELFGQTIPPSITTPDGREIDETYHLLSRAAFGPWPGDLDYVRSIGAEAWIEEQLAPDAIDDTACDIRARRFETIHLEPGTCYEFKKPVLREELARHTVLRAIYSKRQLFEVMVHFWTDHLNIYQEKGDCIYLKSADDRTVVRTHALGRFRDLIRASALSPAMLFYLDGKENRKAEPSDVPNENYARELLELHTLGVDGGYTQTDVREIARCLTGWVLRTTWRKGTVAFDPALHDDGEKFVLGHRIPAGGGERDLDHVIDIACDHPSTARFIARKLVRHFVADPPPQAAVDRVAGTFARSNGDIREVVKEVFLCDEFGAARAARIKRPFEFIVSSLRLLGADTHAHASLLEWLGRLGESPFQYPTPDGYPDEPEHWMGTLLWRWNFAFAVALGAVDTVAVDLPRLFASAGIGTPERFDSARLFAYLVGRSPTDVERRTLVEFERTCPPESDTAAYSVALVLASPAFQRH